VIDLHLHTTVSDGRCTPEELVARAAAVGLTVIAATDHDTVGATQEVRAHSLQREIEAIVGIEITAVDEGRDVHILGYFLNPDDDDLTRFLAQQREVRLERVEKIGRRLSDLGVPIDAPSIVAEARRHPGRSVGRPQIARAMIAAGHVADTREAFDRWLGMHAPAFVPRSGPTPEEVVAIVHRAGGLASLAHPGRTGLDARIQGLRDAGLDAIEVYHPDHEADRVGHYERLAASLGLLVTGGSDFHGDPAYAAGRPGAATLPRAEWERLSAARHRHV
jgi:3',5'-nucleoside bisphosphate phosphatase